MSVSTFRRPGYVDIRIGGIQFNVSNFHRSNPYVRWATGWSGDAWRRTDGTLTWWIDISFLGFGFGACR